MALVTPVARGGSLAWELPHAEDEAKKKKKKKLWEKCKQYREQLSILSQITLFGKKNIGNTSSLVMTTKNVSGHCPEGHGLSLAENH